jgi:tRNA(Ile)-lysidine synthase
LIAAHLNHEWRSAESDAEEQMCLNLCSKLSVHFIAAKLSTIELDKKYNGSKEEYARNARRMFLETVAQAHNAHKIALGHHAQDQQETFFIRLLRGSSLTGLTGIRPQKNRYIRPLLETNKGDILSWLASHGTQYATDSSNFSPLYLRNRIRMNILPSFKQCDNRFDKNFSSTIQQLQDEDDYLERTATSLFKSISTVNDDNTIVVNISLFFEIDKALHKRMILRWLITEKVQCSISSSFFNEIIRFMRSPRGGTHKLNIHWSMVKKNKRASLVQNSC